MRRRGHAIGPLTSFVYHSFMILSILLEPAALYRHDTEITIRNTCK